MRVTLAKSVSEENFQKQKKKLWVCVLSTYVEGSEQVFCYLTLFLSSLDFGVLGMVWEGWMGGSIGYFVRP